MHDATLTSLARWATGMRLEEVPFKVREIAKTQTLCTLGAVHSGYRSDIGLALGRTLRPASLGGTFTISDAIESDPAQAAAMMSAWSVALDYDDVMLGGHTSHSS